MPDQLSSALKSFQNVDKHALNLLDLSDQEVKPPTVEDPSQLTCDLTDINCQYLFIFQEEGEQKKLDEFVDMDSLDRFAEEVGKVQSSSALKDLLNEIAQYNEHLED